MIQRIGAGETARRFTQPDHLAGKGHAALAALGPYLGQSHVDAQGAALVLYQPQLGLCIGGEAVDGHHAGQAVDGGDVLHVPQQVGKAALQRGKVFRAQSPLGTAAVMLEGPDRGHHDHGGRGQARQAALDVQKLFRPQVGAEASLGDDVISHFEGHAGSHDGVAAVGDIGEWTAVDKCGGTLQRLNQVGLQRVFEQGSHGALSL